MRQLIVNADDFGFTRGVNQAILEAHQRGIVTSATLMAQGNELDEAARLAQTVPSLGVGCHLVLLSGSPVLPASQVPRLIAKGNTFRPGWGSFAAAALSGRLIADEIEAEATAQIRKLQRAGIAVTHVDTHKHAHIFPQVLQPVLRAARACGVPAVRNPFERIRLGTTGKISHTWLRWLGVGTLYMFAATFRRMVREYEMATTNGILGIAATGNLDAGLLRNMLAHIPNGPWELVCHPGYDDAQLRSLPTRLLQSRELELQILTSQEARETLAANAIQLISYRDLG